MTKGDSKIDRVLILGGGESGVGAALLAKRCGMSPLVSDNGTLQTKFREELEAHKLPFEEGKHTEKALQWGQVVVKSPGIPEDLPMIVELRKKGISVISEIEFAYQCLPKLQKEAKRSDSNRSLIVGITGSNGKTTSVTWLHFILSKAGYNVGLCGNVGRSFARLLAEEPLYDIYVIELSSFQLDGIVNFRPDIGILLNITPDHLDRYHHHLEEYAASKMRIAENMDANSSFIFWADDPIIPNRIPENAPYYVAPFSTSSATYDYSSAYCDSNALHFLAFDDERHFSIARSQVALPGIHNMRNAMAVSLAAIELGITEEDLRYGLKHFTNVPHRMEFVADIEGVHYINDSKATNIDSAHYALDSQTRPVVLILGGTDKGNDYNEIAPLVKQHCRALIFLGVDNRKLHATFDSMIPVIEEARSMKECVTKASQLAQEGDVVLLSPCCASFDLFSNYEDRGDQFKEEVAKLSQRKRG